MIAGPLKLAARNVLRHRTRTLISLSAIAFGVVALLIAGGFIEWIFWAMRDSTINTGLGHVHVNRPGFRGAGIANPHGFLLKPDAASLDAVRRTPSVVAVDQRLTLSGLVSHGDTTLAFTAEALDPDAHRIISRGLDIDGDNLRADRPSGVLLGRGLAQALDVRRGDSVTFVVSRPNGGINAVEAEVVGMFATEVKAVDDSAARLPIALGRQLLRVEGAHRWVIALQQTEDTDATVASLKTTLPADRYEVSSWEEHSDFYRKAVALMSRQVDLVALLIGVIIVLGITNTLTMNVIERTGEIGTMLALGTSRAGVLGLFIVEGGCSDSPAPSAGWSSASRWLPC
jgi:putative ABC transport system permease protein